MGILKILVYACLSAVFLFSIRELTRHGLEHDYLFLFLAPLISGAGLYFIKRRGAVWLPGLFGLYLFVYRGLWRLTELSQGFSWVIMFKAACFLTVGGLISAGAYYLALAGREAEGKGYRR